MQTPIYLRSLCPGTPVYAWTSGRVWEQLDPQKALLPGSYFLANQVGIEVSCFGAVDIDSFRNLFMGMQHIHTDLYLDALQVVGMRRTSEISMSRWDKLSRPRPVVRPKEKSGIFVMYAFHQPTNTTYELNLERMGAGGWFKVKGIPKSVKALDVFELWDYKITVVQEPVCLPAPCTKRLITSTFDNLFCYDLDDESLKSYLAYAQPIIKGVWERRNMLGSADNKAATGNTKS